MKNNRSEKRAPRRAGPRRAARAAGEQAPRAAGAERDERAGRAELLKDLTLLGQERHHPTRRLETFPNQHPGRRYWVTLESSEFTCLCPATGQPDFATLTIRYLPGPRIVESKSLKLYLWSFRDEGHFHEHVTNVILDDLVAALDPLRCEVTGRFNVRGGITITVEASYEKESRPESPEDGAAGRARRPRAGQRAPGR